MTAAAVMIKVVLTRSRGSGSWQQLKRKITFLNIYTRIDKNQELFFFIKNIFGMLKVPSESMSGDGLSRKLVELSKGKNVLEFGSGGSSLIFAKNSHSLISVESDFFYARKLMKLTRKFAHTRILWANIGPTKTYGYPIRRLEIIFRNCWPKYALRPWGDETRNTNLVFVDGRFRVSSTMQCFLNIESAFILVFDDYFSRSEYHFVEIFLGKPKEKIGDSALFEIPDQSQRDKIDVKKWREYEKYIYDCR